MALFRVASTGLAFCASLWYGNAQENSSLSSSPLSANSTGAVKIARIAKPNYDWTALRARLAPKENWKGLYVNITENRNAAAVLTPDNAFFQTYEVGNGTGSAMSLLNKPKQDIVFLGMAIGWSWATALQVANLGVGLASAVTVIQGCVTTTGAAGRQSAALQGSLVRFWELGLPPS
jgi:hypothetical protein